MATVRFQTPTAVFEGDLRASLVSRAVLDALPITSTVQRWGEEIYFDVAVRSPQVSPTLDVEVGDIAYWPGGPSLCIFFGRTPASRGSEPRPASEVSIVGHTEAPVELLRSIREGEFIVVSHAGAGENPPVRS